MWYKRLSCILAFLTLIGTVHGQSGEIYCEWEHLGPFSTPPSTAKKNHWSCTGIGWIESIVVEEQGNKLYAGSITGGLFYSNDGAENWQQIHHNGLQTGILDMVIRKKKIYVATGLTHYGEKFGRGIFYSKNLGKSWKATGLQFEFKDKKPCWVLRVFDTDKGVFKKGRGFIACTENEIYRSVNKAKTWTKIFEGESVNFRQLLVSGTNQNIMLASGSKLYRSVDGGLNWQEITDSLSFKHKDISGDIGQERIALCEDPNIRGRLLALYARGTYTYIDESLDYGLNWKSLFATNKIRGITIHHAEIAIAPGNSNIVMLGAVRAYLSRDGARSFEQVSFPNYAAPGFVHDDIRSMLLLDSLHFYLGTDGGLFMSEDGGKTWQDKNGYGLTALMAYGIGLRDKGFAVGCQDLGLMVYEDGHWFNVGDIYGDGGDNLILGNTQILTLNGHLRMLDKEQFKDKYFTSPPTNMFPFTGTIKAHPGSSDTFYYVSDHTWMYTGENWVNLTEKIDNKGYKANSLEVCKANADSMFYALDQPTWSNPAFSAKFFRSTNAGLTWVNITKNLSILDWRFITSITSNSSNANEVYISMGILDDEEIHKVYRSLDGGETWENWSEGLPPLETFKISFIEGSVSGLLLASVGGMYYRNAANKQWLRMVGDMPQIAVRDFEIDYRSGELLVSTYGNGVWKLKLSEDMRSL